MKDLISKNLTTIIQKVTYPLLSKANGDPIRLKRGYRQIIQTSSFVVFPGMMLLIILANPILVYVLGKQWEPATPFLQIVCASGVLYHLHSINLNILKVLGRSDLFLKLEIIKKVNTTIAIFIGLPFGIYGLLIGKVISSYIALFINTWYTAKFLDYTIKEQVLDVIKVLVLSIPMVLILTGVLLFQPVESLIMLLGYILFSILVYLITNLFFRTTIVNTLVEMVNPYLPKKIKQLLKV